MDAFQGKFVVGRNSDILRRFIVDGSYEAENVQLCRRFLVPGKDAVDVGANIGFFTVLFAKCLPDRRVLSVEPTPGALERLKKNMVLNDTERNTIVFEGMASSADGAADIKIVLGKEEYSTAGELAHPSTSGLPFVVMRVQKACLDALVSAHDLKPGLVKIDAEGGEKEVLLGAERLLREQRPVVISELSDFLLRRNGTSSHEIIELLERLGYNIYNALDPAIPPGHGDFEDILCLPKEKTGTLSKKRRA